jgi:hypothetical protein
LELSYINFYRRNSQGKNQPRNYSKNTSIRLFYIREEIPEYTSKGDALMNFGIQVEPRGDYDCQIIKIEEV